MVKTPLLICIKFYQTLISPLLGKNCRFYPTCSAYALEAIDTNGAWKGGWLTAARMCRCHPWGSAGYDPVPDLTCEHHPFAPWRYGRWTGRHIKQKWTAQDKTTRPQDQR